MNILVLNCGSSSLRFQVIDTDEKRIEAMARFYGMLAGVTCAEPFLQKEVGLVEDVTAIPVKSI